MKPSMPVQDKRGTITLAKLAACTICLLIFVATLDTIPDPPALTPQPVQQILTSRLSHSPFTPAAATLATFSAHAVHGPNLGLVTQFAGLQTPEHALNSATYALLARASDASPPPSS
jgi:hypothetical protein